MDDINGPQVWGSGISVTERETGLSKDILRVWERRYGFPRPLRDMHGERRYQAGEIEKLRVLKQLLDRGHRPAKLVHQSIAELRAKLEESVTPGAAPHPCSAELDACFDAVRDANQEVLKERLSRLLLRLGLARFVNDIVAPLNVLVGKAWSSGRLEVFQEHLYTAAVEALLRASIGALPRSPAQPRILLTTLPHELHGLGLLMAETLLALQGCTCIAMGLQTPLSDIVEAARTQQADIVALSFAGSGRPAITLESLRALRAQLPQAVMLWAGGSGAVAPQPITGLTIIRTLQGPEGLDAALAGWHASRGRA